jgi:hypothetical protein
MRKLLNIILVGIATMACPAAFAASGKLTVSVSVVPSCKLAVSVLKAGSEPRSAGGSGSFSVSCTRMATASAAAGDGGVNTAAAPQTELRVTKGITPDSRLQHVASAEDYADTVVSELLF